MEKIDIAKRVRELNATSEAYYNSDKNGLILFLFLIYVFSLFYLIISNLLSKSYGENSLLQKLNLSPFCVG